MLKSCSEITVDIHYRFLPIKSAFLSAQATKTMTVWRNVPIIGFGNATDSFRTGRIVQFHGIGIFQIIFKNLQFILLFLNVWTLTFYYFSLKSGFTYFGTFVSRTTAGLWLSKCPSYHSAKLTTLLNYIISIYNFL